ncbi:MAG: transketolase [Chloroflexi bacterium]|nr:transketolase [Chloroflexota bacterium]
MIDWRDDARRVAQGIRRRVLEHTINSNGGYLSQACSSAETLAVLYTKVMRLGPSIAPPVPPPFPGAPSKTNPRYTGAGYNGARAPELDRFFLSAVHYALALYAALIETGRMSPDGLAQFNKDGSTVEMIGAEHSPGLEVTGGSLAQTISQAGGVALARRLRRESGRNWVFMSDGEFQSGQTWEAVQALCFYRLDNVCVYVDVNGQQCDGAMEEVMKIEPLQSRLESFSARVCSVNGHDLDALAAPAELAPDGRPLFILAYTDPCAGMPILDPRRPKLHYLRFKDAGERDQFADYLKTMDG